MTVMSTTGQLSEHLIIREYLGELLRARTISRERLTDVFVPVYLAMVAPGSDVPGFDQVHRLDSIDTKDRKDGANLKKLWRAIDGKTYLPIVFKLPLIVSLDRIQVGLGKELHKRLVRNAGLLYLPIDMERRAFSAHADWLNEVSQANVAMIEDLSSDGLLNRNSSKAEILDVIEKSVQLL